MRIPCDIIGDAVESTGLEEGSETQTQCTPKFEGREPMHPCLEVETHRKWGIDLAGKRPEDTVGSSRPPKIKSSRVQGTLYLN